ncbi:10197_t:CDS:2 [Funneliformis caledonium]|uniref:10197_t:CDS:1 n=1 Tax=Funneliformis caledonium TaxID=1117310 RepID=A0A9N9D1R4_9GLOM|nr:10197_t:CDS:2 [Funneliformis caledonium]
MQMLKFESLDRHNKLSEELKSFSITAQGQLIKYIKEKLSSTKLLVTRPISVTIDKVQIQSAEHSMKKEKLILVIESLIRSLNKTNLSQLQGLKSKRKDELLIILQQVRDLAIGNEIN